MTIDKSQFEPGTEEWMALAFPKAETRPVRDEDVDLVAYKLEQWDMKDPPNDCTGHDYRDIARDILTTLSRPETEALMRKAAFADTEHKYDVASPVGEDEVDRAIALLETGLQHPPTMFYTQPHALSEAVRTVIRSALSTRPTYAQGVEDGLERAAKVADEYYAEKPWSIRNHCGDQIATAIRAKGTSDG